VLDAFPEIHRVKCVNHTAIAPVPDEDGREAHGVSPGHVLVVPIARTDSRVTDPRRPYTRKSTLTRIERFLRKRMSPFVRLNVLNPKITEVQMKMRPVFHEDILDIGFYEEQLIEALQGYFMPWAADDSVEPEFGGRWYKAAVIDYVEDLAWVDHVRDVEMYHRTDVSGPDAAWPRIDTEIIELKDPHAILVSHETHDIVAVQSP
jgi:hypothetical protein